MVWLVTGLVLFLGIHLVPSFVGLRASLVARLGEKSYQGLFSLIALAGLVFIVLGMMWASYQPLYTPPQWGRYPALVVMPLVMILLAGANMPSNLKRFTRHPMLWGVFLWSAVHLLANGDRASVALFASFGVYAVVDMITANRRGAQLAVQRYPLSKDAMLVAAGLVVYGVFLWLHPYLFGVPALV